MQNDGKLVFGIQSGSQHKITTAKAYNDGQWHHVVGTQSADGIRLFVDAQPVGSNPQATADNYNGYWRVAGDTTWGSTSRFLNGTLDEAAVYPTALSGGSHRRALHAERSHHHQPGPGRRVHVLEPVPGCRLRRDDIVRRRRSGGVVRLELR